MTMVSVVFVTLLPLLLSGGIKSMLFGDSYFSIQNLMWIIFFIGLGELLHRFLISTKISKGFHKSYLPEDDTSILEFTDMPNLFKKIKSDALLDESLANFLKKLVIQFQTSHSIDQTHQMLNSQSDMMQVTNDLHYNMIRYITWLIPTLGFIGTVMGIMMGLDYAASNDPKTDYFLGEVTAQLAVAFYTTLIALMMSTVLVFLTHLIQGKEEKLLVKTTQYCLDNFINRLYVSKE